MYRIRSHGSGHRLCEDLYSRLKMGYTIYYAQGVLFCLLCGQLEARYAPDYVEANI